MFWKRKQKPLCTPLHQAVLDDDLEGVKKHLNYRSARDEFGLSAEDLACYLGRASILAVFRKPKNVFVNLQKKNGVVQLDEEEFLKTFNVHYRQDICFDDYDTLKIAIKKSKKVMKQEKLKTQNHWTLALHKKAHIGNSLDCSAIRWVNPLIGYGVFATRTIPALTYIGEYTGIVRKRRRRKDRFNNYIFSYVAGPKETEFIIDALYEGNFTRFINHSDSPNLTSRWMEIDGVSHIILFANRAIPKGEQLSYDYGAFYWRSRSYPQTL